MALPDRRTFPCALPVICVAVLVSESWLPAKTRALSAAESTAPPQLIVRVYGFAGISPSTIAMAEKEAERMLRDVYVRLNWVNCVPPMVASSCASEELPGDLSVRILAKAPRQANSQALGMTSGPSDHAVAFVFYDRVIMLRTHTRQLTHILGRVLAHEIGHLLVPLEAHSDLGLMRSQWRPEDLDPLSGRCLGLSTRFQNEAQKNVLRRLFHEKAKIIE